MTWGRRILLATALALVSVMTGRPALADTQCGVQHPETAVFDLVAKDKPNERLGTAFLVDWQRALFLTAYHNLAEAQQGASQGSLLLKSGTMILPFSVVSSGRSIYSLEDDWSLLRAKVPSPVNGLFPLQDLPLVYDVASVSDFSNTAILASGRTLLQVASVDFVNRSPGGSTCGVAKVAMLRAGSYSKGYSGAPVFSNSMCGVVGVASRFSLPLDAEKPDEQYIVKAFWEFVEASDDAPTTSGASALSAPARLKLMSEFLKDKTFIKIVPSSCIVDHVVAEPDDGYDHRSTRLLATYLRDMVRVTKTAIDTLDPGNIDTSSLIAWQIEKENWDWIDLLQLLDTYYRRYERVSPPINPTLGIRLVRDALAINKQRMHFSRIDAAFAAEEPILAEADTPAEPVDAAEGSKEGSGSEPVEDGLAKTISLEAPPIGSPPITNRQYASDILLLWQLAPNKLPQSSTDDLPAPDALALGRALAASYTKTSTNGAQADAGYREYLRQSSLAYLSKAVTSPGASAIDDNSFGEALVNIASLSDPKDDSTRYFANAVLGSSVALIDKSNFSYIALASIKLNELAIAGVDPKLNFPTSELPAWAHVEKRPGHNWIVHVDPDWSIDKQVVKGIPDYDAIDAKGYLKPQIDIGGVTITNKSPSFMLNKGLAITH